jgi:hypothetical protein
VAVDYLEGSADPKTVAEALTRAGYPARYLSSGASPPGARPRTGCGGSCCGG